MLSKNIKYTDYNGVEREEAFLFNLSKAELMEMELSADGGLEATINKIIAAQNGKEIMELFKEIVLKAYGEKSLDGKTFDKSPEVKNRFINSQAYSDIFMELATNADEATKFFNGIIPKDIANEVKKQNLKAVPAN